MRYGDSQPQYTPVGWAELSISAPVQHIQHRMLPQARLAQIQSKCIALLVPTMPELLAHSNWEAVRSLVLGV